MVNFGYNPQLMSTNPSAAQYRRVLLKISGEMLAGGQGFGLDAETINYIAGEIVKVFEAGVQVAVVVGGGNFIRGEVFSAQGGLDRSIADQMGMLGTVMNALAMQAAIEKLDVPVRVQSAITVSQVAEPFIVRRAVRHLEKGRIVIFASGTGNPYFTTDTAGVLRALEIHANAFLKATKVDGVYDKDPKKHADAVKYHQVSFAEVLDKRLAVMDQTAFTMCREHELPVIVLDLSQKDSMLNAVLGHAVGTLVKGD